ncbi:MAG: thiolase family protein [Candidatus Bipolaricaulia bacterium]
MRLDKEIVIIDGARTPFGHYGGTLKDLSPKDLAVTAAKAALERSKVDPELIDQVIFGNAADSSADAMYLARHVGLMVGVPQEKPALLLCRICGSGLEAIVTGARYILLDEADFVLAGGTESMNNYPYVMDGARWGMGFGGGKIEDWLQLNFLDTYNNLIMGQTAENLIERYKISREEQDEFAHRSHMLAHKATEEGRLAEEIVPLEITDRKGKTTLFEHDEHIRPDTTIEALNKLRPVFKKDGTITPGNACPISDGAAMVVVTTMEKAKELGLEPLGRLVSWGTAGVDPDIMGIGPVPAVRQALQRAGLSLQDIDLIELNEAFAGQVLSCVKELGIDTERLNVNGGAIAIGHPTAATGTRLVLTLLKELRRRGKQLGLVTMCIGGGQGMAGVFEAI